MLWGAINCIALGWWEFMYTTDCSMSPLKRTIVLATSFPAVFGVTQSFVQLLPSFCCVRPTFAALLAVVVQTSQSILGCLLSPHIDTYQH